MVWLVRGISRGWTDIPQENRRYPTNLELSLEKPSTRLNNAWDAETSRGSLPQRVPRHFVRCPARYDFWGRERFSTLKHNTQDNTTWLLTSLRGFVYPKTARTLPTSLSWKAAVSAPKSRVCVLCSAPRRGLPRLGGQGFRRCGRLPVHFRIPAFPLLHAENQRG